MGELDIITGPMLIGTILNVFLLGILVQQCYIYFVSYPRDRAWMKIMVAFVLSLEVVITAFDTAFTYKYTMAKYGQVSEIQKTEWMFNTEPVMTVVLSSTVQLFYAWRLKTLTGKMWLSLVINFCVCIQFLGGIAATIGGAIVREFVQYQRFKIIVTAWLIMTPLIDIAITTTLVWYLMRHKTGFIDTDDLVTRVIRLTVQTGAATAVWSIIALVMYLACHNTLHLIVGIPLSKLYTVSLMSSLNARRWRSEVTNGGLTRPPRIHETSSTSTVLVICRHAPANSDQSLTRPTPSSASFVNNSPIPRLECQRGGPSLIDAVFTDQDELTQDLADTKISDVNWHKADARDNLDQGHRSRDWRKRIGYPFNIAKRSGGTCCMVYPS